MSALASGAGAGTSAPGPIEQGLRDLANGEGPVLGKLVEPRTRGLRALMELTAPLADAGMHIEGRARAIRQYIWELIAGLDDQQHPKCKAALRAAFCLAPEVSSNRELTSVASRLEVMALAGAFGEKSDLRRAQESWELAARRLAWLVTKNIDDHLRLAAGWASIGAPSGYQPLRVSSLVVTYYLTGQTVTDVITERRIEAMEDGVDRYIVRDYVQGVPDAEIEVKPLLNCRSGEHMPVDLGPGFVAMKAEMLLPKAYARGDGCNFATRVKRKGVTGPTTWQEIQVTSYGVDALIMRIQFDLGEALPVRCWYFAAAPDVGRLEPPGPGEQRDLEISRFGYTERDFGAGQAAAKYGIIWRW
jgi:hypothetical protein